MLHCHCTKTPASEGKKNPFTTVNNVFVVALHTPSTIGLYELTTIKINFTMTVPYTYGRNDVKLQYIQAVRILRSIMAVPN